MVDLVLTEEQARIAEQAGEMVRLRAPDGRIIGSIDRFVITDEMIAEAKRRLASDEPRIPSATVQAHLRALQEEWDRTGGFDEAYMRDFLAKLRAAEGG